MGIADTYVSTGAPAPAPVPVPAPITGPQAAGTERTMTPDGPMPAPGANIAAPEIGAESSDSGGFAGLPDLPEMNPEAAVGSVLADRYRILKLRSIHFNDVRKFFCLVVK